ncbi:SGNH/GDSL hydrolase family protein [Listeria rocourtiae]|uniref:SGNH/GDSL hydrolase family protein n=1 Tax=Listeria rocourtiae TaxID=647910 RepID=UPI00162795BA|nr:SGNH/GDSL hydrolase family protein [Listeria rocourtiae]MBC1435790.1 SGNH/GDSL hydrolase family protein [Listeria rocourtiae]MBC1604112.1 SGNH/GDSL hydrolase family protein [Listeria rocourtiae]
MQHKKTWGKIALGSVLLLTVLTLSTGKVSAAETTDWTKVTWNAMGDSLTTENNTLATKRYFNYIQEDLHIKQVNNYGMNGSTVGNLFAPISERYTTMDSSANLITVFAGINDYGKGQALGTPSDTTNKTYYGALDVLLKGLIKKYPGQKIGFISMYKQSFFPPVNKLGIPDYAYINAAIEVCHRYNIKHLNLYDLDSFDLSKPDVNGYSVGDGIHLNNKGHRHLADTMEVFIKGL